MTAPSIQVVPNADGRTVRFKCPHCRRNHTHGIEGVSDGTRTHRVAHCWRAGSPFMAAGYHLQLAPRGRAVTARAVMP